MSHRSVWAACCIVGSAPWVGGALVAFEYSGHVALQSAATVALLAWTPACVLAGLLFTAQRPA